MVEKTEVLHVRKWRVQQLRDSGGECHSALGQPTQLDQPADNCVGGESQDTAGSRVVRNWAD
jgi:hypothetical protein